MLKGSTLTRETLPASIRRRLPSPEAQQEYVRAHNGRWAIVAKDSDGTPLVAEELDARALRRLSPKARRIAGAMLRLSEEERLEVLGAFTAAGNLKRPFEAVAG